MRLDEYARYDGVGLSKLVENGDITATHLIELANAAIDRLNPTLNCVVNRIPDVGPSSGILQGIPFLIKEGTAAIAGQPWNMASRLGVGHVAKDDDESTARFRCAGLTIIGQSNTPEACNAPTTESVLHGRTRNPWNVNYMPGGSSGGAASAVAAGIVPIAHATDGAGSIRIPASCCGLVGLKPTRARTPINQAAIFSLTASHVVTRTVRDSAAILDLTQGPQVGAIFHAPPPRNPYVQEADRAPGKLRVAFTTMSAAGTTVHADCVNSVLNAAKTCAALGHDVEEVMLNYDWDALLAAIVDLYSYRHPLNVEALERATGLRVGPNTRETCNLAMLAHANQLTMLEFARHMEDLSRICQAVGKQFAKWDIFVSPVMNQPALPLGVMNANEPGLTATRWFEKQFTQYAPFTAVFNATGQPAISLPLGQSASDLPIGVQFVAKHGDEATLLQLARQLEVELPWRQRKPQISIF